MTARQGCFDCTDWSVFREAHITDVNDYAEVVSGYIQKHAEDVSVIKSITNQKPWMSTEARALLYLLTLLSRGLQEPVETERAPGQKIQNYFGDHKDTRRLWLGIQACPPPARG